jgi:hypothetical protein
MRHAAQWKSKHAQQRQLNWLPWNNLLYQSALVYERKQRRIPGVRAIF